MSFIQNLQERDLASFWHPCSQMKDYEQFPPIVITKAKGVYLYSNEHKIFDAISSWWCKSLGHCHEKIDQAVRLQMTKFGHVIMANTTNQLAVEFCENLLSLFNSYTKVFCADSGSDGIEVALKMALQYHKQTNSNKVKFASLENAYHGETTLCLSVSDCSLYSNKYQELLIDVQTLSKIPYCSGKNDPLWHDCNEQWQVFEKQLSSDLAAIIIEPILQGASGMKIYSKDFLQRLHSWCKQNNVLLIADEILAGSGRTGHMLACNHAEIEADICILSKGLTGGFMPFSCVLTNEEIYQVFYGIKDKAFLHSHTFSGNVIAMAAAQATLAIYQEENIFQKVQNQEDFLLQEFTKICNKLGCFTNIRGIGFMVSCDLINELDSYKIYQHAIKLGIFLRPLGNTFYLMPPLNSTLEELKLMLHLFEKTFQSFL